MNPFKMTGPLRNKWFLDELTTEILFGSSQIDTSDDGRMNYKDMHNMKMVCMKWQYHLLVLMGLWTW
jgi:hypothetical protein